MDENLKITYCFYTLNPPSQAARPLRLPSNMAAYLVKHLPSADTWRKT